MKPRVVAALSASAIALAVIAFEFGRSEPGTPEEVASTPNSSEQVHSGVAAESLPSSALLYYSNDLIQYVAFEPGQKNLVFHSVERPPGATLPDQGEPLQLSTSYTINKVIHAGQADCFYVHGRGRGGADILERWTVSSLTGAYFADRPQSQSPIGTPGQMQPLNTGIVGGTWVHPLGRTEVVAVDRTEVYRDTTLGVIRGIAADPDGRFILALAGPSLYRIDLPDGSGPPTEILTVNDYPELDDADHIFIWQFVTGSRYAVIESISGAYEPTRAILEDANNDGLFSAPAIFSIPLWIQAGLDDDGVWAEDYVHF